MIVRKLKTAVRGNVAFYKFVRLKDGFYLKPDSEDEV